MTYTKALTIAGSDSGGGAGIQADLKTFQELEVYGMSAITALTAQNTVGVQGVYPASTEALHAQIESVLSDIGADAIKTGMLYDEERIDIVASFAKKSNFPPLIVDPVMISTSGTPLLKEEAKQAMMEKLFPHAVLITPNIPEAEAMTNISASSLKARKDIARELLTFGSEAVLIKGGHEEDADEITDILFDGAEFHYFTSPKISTSHTHGTGCTFAAAITAYTAMGKSMHDAVRAAKIFVYQALSRAETIGSGAGPVYHAAHRTAEGAPVKMEVERE
ncbi:bifunctional hydroxymethylpyrimidine kinase/phosphomethylpyrimidine kinase [Alkalicoccus halolimnae]|uniref:Hydroxymethylpyrimidine/phosphomethylpyrimidine kinase n=1 Tax=Alkalicoccus halolimnae TaxID=1667239 RepID=A0A5C7F354_9BACI|nr:bifunctional hydroxymethylpyrimidine kinase/phosphomethylpyrimidine kinase [Alkalicoccus halolimnae]TXF85081.1 bifunctional hydroxymethylpyrimidine kinase/phosphomethylpyrimidine kinase [Alkalicoccus halolimnae]